jgi:hypothetical protein
MRRSTLSWPATFAAALLFIAVATDGASQSKAFWRRDGRQQRALAAQWLTQPTPGTART